MLEEGQHHFNGYDDDAVDDDDDDVDGDDVDDDDETVSQAS